MSKHKNIFVIILLNTGISICTTFRIQLKIRTRIKLTYHQSNFLHFLNDFTKNPLKKEILLFSTIAK